MSFKVSGDFAAKMDRWAELLNTASVIVKHTSKAQAEVALTLIGEGFEDETDPYGRKWAKKKTPDGRKVLHGETSRLRTGWHVAKAGADGWRVDPSVPYAAFNQAPRGGSRPARMQVPSSSRGLPREWAKELKAVAIEEALTHFAIAADGTAPSHTKKTRSAPAAASGGSRSSGGKRRAGRRGLRQLRTRRSR